MRWMRVVMCVLAVGCGKASNTASAPAPASTPAPAAAEQDTTITLRIGKDTVPARMSPDLQQQMQAELEASRRASMSAVSATVRVDTLRLKVGAQVPFFDLGIVAKDSAGNVIPKFGPSLRIEDRSIATLQGPNITGMKVGETAIIIGARTENPTTNEVWMRDLVRVPIIVEN